MVSAMMPSGAAAHLRFNGHQYRYQAAAKTRDAINALEAAEVASGDESLIEACGLLGTSGAQPAAAALLMTMTAIQRCHAGVLPLLKEAERAVRDVIVSRCCSWPRLRDRGAFLEAAEQAFGGPLERGLRAVLLLSYHKMVKATLGDDNVIFEPTRVEPTRGRRRNADPRDVTDVPIAAASTAASATSASIVLCLAALLDADHDKHLPELVDVGTQTEPLLPLPKALFRRGEKRRLESVPEE